MNDDSPISPPGDTIKEILGATGMSEREFAKEMNMTVYQVRELIEGSMIITPDIADRLEHALDVHHEIWITMEWAYRDKLKTDR